MFSNNKKIQRFLLKNKLEKTILKINELKI